MSAYWINFMKTGNPPNSPGLAEWKSYDANTQSIMELGSTPILKPSLLKAEFQFLESMEKL